MHNKGKGIEHLKLQSYKVDSQILVSKINELNDLKSQLQNTLSKHRTQQNSIFDELEQLKAENQKLRATVSDLEFTKKSQAYLITQLQKRLESAESKALTYSQRLNQEEREKGSLKDFYEKKICMLNQSIEQQKVSRVTEFDHRNSPQHPFNLSNNSISSIDENSKCESNKKIKKLKKPSLQPPISARPSVQISNKYHTSNAILEKEEDSHFSGEDVYLQMIRQLYKQLLKIQIRGNDLLKIPQIDAFSKLRNPSKNDLAKLCRSYPFHINQANKIDLIFEFITKEAERRGALLNGKFIIDEIIQQIDEIDCQNENHSSAQLSSFALDEILHSGNKYSQKDRHFSKGSESTSKKQIKQSSFDSGLQNDSQYSNYY